MCDVKMEFTQKNLQSRLMSKRLSIYLFPLLVLVLFILTNCGGILTGPPHLRVYKGPAQPKEQVGTLQRLAALRIDEIDGLTNEEIKEMSNFESYAFNAAFSAWDLLPGKHILKISGVASPHPGFVLNEEYEWGDQEEYTSETVTYRNGLREFYHIKGTWEIEFTVEYGHKYMLQYDGKEEEGLKDTVSRVYPYVIDEKTFEKVSTCKRLKK